MVCVFYWCADMIALWASAVRVALDDSWSRSIEAVMRKMMRVVGHRVTSLYDFPQSTLIGQIVGTTSFSTRVALTLVFAIGLTNHEGASGCCQALIPPST